MFHFERKCMKTCKNVEHWLWLEIYSYGGYNGETAGVNTPEGMEHV